FNFRPDRARQICHALEPVCNPLAIMTRYDATLKGPVAFDTENVRETLADVLEEAGVEQFHVAETEKYAHVTYFFNGGVGQPHAQEVGDVGPSRRDGRTYDKKPEMGGEGVSDGLGAALETGRYRFLIANFATPDMVGHTGVIPAVIEAV